MKEIVILGIIGSTIGFLFWYGAFAFTNLEANPLKWDESVRIPFTIFLPIIIILFALTPITVSEFYKTLKNK